MIHKGANYRILDKRFSYFAMTAPHSRNEEFQLNNNFQNDTCNQILTSNCNLPRHIFSHKTPKSKFYNATHLMGYQISTIETIY